MPANRRKIPALPKCACGQEIPPNVERCIVCGIDVGFPNVRYAERQLERDALDTRLSAARVSANARGCRLRLEAFGRIVATSKTVISRSQGDLCNLLGGSGELMQAFYPAVRAGLRMPRNNEFDPQREANDSRVNPFFYSDLHFGALSIDGRGVPHYGNCAITLREDMTGRRTTVFEENPMIFATNHPSGGSDTIPYGYRAVWGDRAKLAMAKLGTKIEATTTDDEFPGILMETTARSSGYTDFVEAHLYGPLHPRAFEHVHAVVIDDEFERLQWNRMKPRLVSFGITFEEILL